MTPEQASDFYAEHYGKMFFPSLIAYMSRYCLCNSVLCMYLPASRCSGPVLALVLAKTDAVNQWKQLVGSNRREQDPGR